MIKLEKHVDIDTAKELKKLGYDYFCRVWYDIDEKDRISYGKLAAADAPWRAPCPRVEDVIYWLVDKHKISIEHFWMHNKWNFYAVDMNSLVRIVDEIADEDYDTALNNTLQSVLLHIKS